MAVCGSLMEDDEDDMALLALFQKWFLDALHFARALFSAFPALAARFFRLRRWPDSGRVRRKLSTDQGSSFLRLTGVVLKSPLVVPLVKPRQGKQ